jgi:hypothetical protein
MTLEKQVEELNSKLKELENKVRDKVLVLLFFCHCFLSRHSCPNSCGFSPEQDKQLLRAMKKSELLKTKLLESQPVSVSVQQQTDKVRSCL